MALRSSVLILCVAFALFFAPRYVRGNSCKDWFPEDCSGYDPDDCMKELNQIDCLKMSSGTARQVQITEKCREKICFILKLEPGLIDVNKNESIPTEPILCKAIRTKYPHISGPVLDIFRETFTDEELCLFVSDETCGNFELMHYVQSTMAKNYNFAIGPIAEATLEKCVHRESGAWLDDRIVVVGSFEESGNFERALLVFDPFQVGAIWFIFAMFLLCFGFALLIYIRVVIKGRSKGIPFYFILTGAYDDADAFYTSRKENLETQIEAGGNDYSSSGGNSTAARTDVAGEEDGKQKKRGKLDIIPMKYAVITSLLRFAFFAIVIIFFLYLEAGAVNDLSERQSELNKRFQRQFEEITDKSRYCVQDRSVLSEAIERKVQNTRTNFTKKPSIEDCFDELTKPRSEVGFVVTHKLAADFILSDRDLCDQYTVLELESNIYEFNSRWIFNSNVPRDYLERFDRKLVSLRIQGTIQNLLSRYAPECAPPSRSFRFRTGHTLLPVLVFVGVPFMVGILGGAYTIWRNQKD